VVFLAASLRSRTGLQLEILALRHQIGVLQRSVKRPKLTPADRRLWAWLYSVGNDWQSAVFIVKAATVVGWHREGFGLFWSWKIGRGKPGRPPVPKEIRELIRTMRRENPLRGAPHIHGELLKLGIHIGETSVSKYMVRRRKPSLADLEDIPRQSPEEHGVCGLFHRTDDPVPDPVRVPVLAHERRRMA
jgi:putative transposase